MGFVDLHSHVIPGVDDGPETWEESMEMLRNAARCGTDLIVATPHGGDRGRWDRVDSLERLCRELNEASVQEELPLRVALGMENPIELDVVGQIEKGAALTINSSSYILIELPFSQLPIYWEESLFQLQLQGLRPVIAHPERQAQIQDDPSLLAGAVNRGVLAQVTGGSLVGRFGPKVRKTADTLLKKGLVHIVASDCHGPDGSRGPDLQKAFDAAAKLAGRERAVKMLSETPRAIAHGYQAGSIRS